MAVKKSQQVETIIFQASPVVAMLPFLREMSQLEQIFRADFRTAKEKRQGFAVD